MYIIENNDRPGNFWDPASKQFNSGFSGEYKTYRTVRGALPAFNKLCRDGRSTTVRHITHSGGGYTLSGPIDL